MLIVTGILMTWVLVILVGTTVQTFQVVGWLPVAPIEGLRLPYWAGTWLGIYPTWQGVIAQVAAAAFVVGSYLAAEHVRARGGGGECSPPSRPPPLSAVRAAELGFARRCAASPLCSSSFARVPGRGCTRRT